jgi:glycosyltransferase involved in cell wall biosynthesis
MLAPEPFFQPRGTPISVYFRLKALSALGHEVDLITYPLGENKTFKKLRILRIPNLICVKKIKIGPSLVKIPLDFFMLLKALWQLLVRRYDLIFSHEEAALIGTVLARIWKKPHVYDMHSSLPQQLQNFDFTKSRSLIAVFNWIENFVLRHSRAIIVICPDLQEKVKKIGFIEKAVLLENFLDFEHRIPTHDEIMTERRKLASDTAKIVLYVGNFQPYQGIPLLLDAAAQIEDKNIVFLFVGGGSSQVSLVKKKTKALDHTENLRFIGQVPPEKVPLYIMMADAMVSPRISGTNTPLKIYSYLKSGKPLVATKLWTHTQILNENMSILVNPDGESLAEGISKALHDENAQIRAITAKEFTEKEFTFPKYLEKISLVLHKAFH